jgi:hypothetical protein
MVSETAGTAPPGYDTGNSLRFEKRESRFNHVHDNCLQEAGAEQLLHAEQAAWCFSQQQACATADPLLKMNWYNLKYFTV